MSAWMRICLVVVFLTALLGIPAIPVAVSAQISTPIISNESETPFTCLSVTEIPLEECQALVSFYDQTGGPRWLRSTNWLETNAPSTWYGVAVRHGHVIGLSLKNNGLTGEIPVSLAGFSKLTHLELDGNPLQGEIPERLQMMAGSKSSPLAPLPDDEYRSLDDLPDLQVASQSSVPQPGINLKPITIQLPYVVPGESGYNVTYRDAILDTGKVSPLTAEEALQHTSEQVKTFDCATVTDITLVECQALVALYNSTNGAGWYNSTNWLASTTAANWYGITVNSGHVQDIWVDTNNLVGTIPSELGNLTWMWNFNLVDNQLSGSIPPSLGNLSGALTFHLSYNQLSGALPPELGNLHALYISLNSNQFSGSIPSSLGNLVNVLGLRLSHNFFSGTIPAELGNITTVTELLLSSNQLSGLIPTSLTSLVNLCEPGTCGYYGLDLGYNKLTTAGYSQGLLDFLAVKDPDWAVTQWIPFTSCAAVTEIPVAECNALVAFYTATGGPSWTSHTYWLESGMPGSWNGVAVSGGHVTEIYLDNNNLTGSIPADLTALSSLTTLDLHYNPQMTGTIPTWLGSMTSLQYLNFFYAGFDGTIPSEIGNLTNLNFLSLSYNGLTGSIPATLGNLVNLNGLDLSGNQLTGSLPVGLGALTNLAMLAVRDNALSGPFPSALAPMSSLLELNLDFNGFSGPLPTWLGNLTNLQQVFIGHNQFSGSIPTEIGNLTGLLRLSVPNNQLSGNVPASLTNLVNLCLPDSNLPCWDEYGLDLAYNYLTTPATPQALADFLALKNPGWELTQAVSEALGTSGGEITSNDGDTTLTFPAGSIPAGTIITFVPQTGPFHFTGTLLFANSSFLVEVTAGKFDFALPVSVTLTYADTDLGTQPWLISENSLKLYWWNGANWVDAVTTCTTPSGYIRDTSANTLQLSICKSGEFALLGVYQPMLFLPVVRR